MGPTCDSGSVKMGPQEEYQTASESRNREGGSHGDEEKTALAGSLDDTCLPK